MKTMIPCSRNKSNSKATWVLSKARNWEAWNREDVDSLLYTGHPQARLICGRVDGKRRSTILSSTQGSLRHGRWAGSWTAGGGRRFSLACRAALGTTVSRTTHLGLFHTGLLFYILYINKILAEIDITK